MWVDYLLTPFTFSDLFGGFFSLNFQLHRAGSACHALLHFHIEDAALDHRVVGQFDADLVVDGVVGKGFFAARQTPASRSRTTRAPQILEIIFTGHCTPVQRIQEGGLFAPPRLHAHMQVE